MTKKLYYENAYQTHWKANVLNQDVKDNSLIVELDQTCFYPEGGGQGCDLGKIHNIDVVDVQKKDGKVIHTLQTTEKLPTEVDCELNWERRFLFMQVHTAQHMLSQAFKAIADLDTISVDLNIEGLSGITFQSTKLTDEHIKEAEESANQIIWENRDVSSKDVESKEVHKHTLRRPVKEKILNMTNSIRLIHVLDYDLVACGGVHVEKTGEIGSIKIIEKSKKGDTCSVHFVCGKMALEYFQIANQLTRDFAQFQHIKYHEVNERFPKMLEDFETQRKEVSQLKKAMIQFDAEALFKSAEDKKEYKVIQKIYDESKSTNIKNMTEYLLNTYENIVIFLAQKDSEKSLISFACSENIDIDMNQIFQKYREKLGGKGGGKKNYVQGVAENSEDIEGVFSEILHHV